MSIQQKNSTTTTTTTTTTNNNNNVNGTTQATDANPAYEKALSVYNSALQTALKEVESKFANLSHEERLHALIASVQSLVQIPSDQILSPPLPQVVGKKKPIRVYLDGCFDIMHSGHYNAIRQAKTLGDILVVGVHSDDEITRNKGPPVMNNEERLATVKACKWVDEIAFDTPYDPSLELLDRLNCDFVVHGDDLSTTANGEDAYAKVKAAGRMKVVKRTEGISTTDIVGRLLLMTKQHHVKAVESITVSSPKLRPTFNLDLASVSSLSLDNNGAASPKTTKQGSEEGKKGWTQVDAPASASGISNFLPTTWRISQFSNNRVPTSQDKVVYIDGAFDLFHVGHIETLRKAKELGTFLFVGIHDDKTVNLHKGRNYPIMNLHERVMNVLSCKYVDEVVIGAPWEVTKDLINVLNIHIVVSGSNTKMDQDLEKGPDPHQVAKELNIYKVVETLHLLSTEDVIQRIIDNRMKYEKRNEKRSKKEMAYLANKQFVPEI